MMLQFTISLIEDESRPIMYVKHGLEQRRHIRVMLDTGAVFPVWTKTGDCIFFVSVWTRMNFTEWEAIRMQTLPRKISRGFTATFVAAALSLPIYVGSALLDDTAVAYADVRPSAHLAQREMKKDRNYQTNSLYARAHEMIYGKDGALEDNARPRIAVVINGEENIVVENRVKDQIYRQLRQKFPREYFAVYKGTDVNTALLQYAEEIYYDDREVATTRNTDVTVDETTTGVSVGVNGSRDWSADDTSGAGRGKSHSLGFDSSAGFGSKSVSVNREKVTKPSKVDVDGVPVKMQPRGLSDMRREDYVRAGRQYNYDYVFVLTFAEGKSRVYNKNFILFNTNSNRKNVWMRVRFVDMASGNYLYRNDIVAQGKTHNGYINGRILERSVANALYEALNDIEVDTGIRRQ